MQTLTIFLCAICRKWNCKLDKPVDIWASFKTLPVTENVATHCICPRCKKNRQGLRSAGVRGEQPLIEYSYSRFSPLFHKFFIYCKHERR